MPAIITGVEPGLRVDVDNAPTVGDGMVVDEEFIKDASYSIRRIRFLHATSTNPSVTWATSYINGDR